MLYKQYRNMVSDQVVSLLSVPTKAGASFAVPSIVGLLRNSLYEASAYVPVITITIASCKYCSTVLNLQATWTSPPQ